MAVNPKASMPAADDLINDLTAYWQEEDPKDNAGFSSRDVWEYRYEKFGYRSLFTDWFLYFRPEAF